MFEVESHIVNGNKCIKRILKFPASKTDEEYMENCARLAASLFDHVSNVPGYPLSFDINYLTCLEKETGINTEC